MHKSETACWSKGMRDNVARTQSTWKAEKKREIVEENQEIWRARELMSQIWGSMVERGDEVY